MLPGAVPPQLSDVLPEHLALALKITWAPGERTGEEEELAETFFQERYSTRDWNFSR